MFMIVKTLRRRPGRPTKPIDQAQVMEFHARGRSLRQIARKVGGSKSGNGAVLRRLRKTNASVSKNPTVRSCAERPK